MANAREQLRQSWAGFLGRYPWSLAATLTFGRDRGSIRCGQLPEKTDRAFRRLIRVVNEQLYGRRWMAKSRTCGAIWARVHEFQGDGTSHFHVLFYLPDCHALGAVITQARAFWARNYGHCRVEEVRSSLSARRYLVKHLGDDHMAELDLSHNFGHFR